MFLLLFFSLWNLKIYSRIETHQDDIVYSRNVDAPGGKLKQELLFFQTELCWAIVSSLNLSKCRYFIPLFSCFLFIRYKGKTYPVMTLFVSQNIWSALFDYYLSLNPDCHQAQSCLVKYPLFANITTLGKSYKSCKYSI